MGMNTGTLFSKRMVYGMACTLSVVFISTLLVTPYAFAHEGVDHGTESGVSAEAMHHGPQSGLNLEEMERTIIVLMDLIAVLRQYQGTYGTFVPVSHQKGTLSAVEVEAHDGKTHVHLVYAGGDTEDSFYLNIPMDDSVGIVAAVAARTGLEPMAIRSILVYF
jgi:hypothetical protein